MSLYLARLIVCIVVGRHPSTRLEMWRYDNNTQCRIHSQDPGSEHDLMLHFSASTDEQDMAKQTLGDPTAQAGRLPRFNVESATAAKDMLTSRRHFSQSILRYSMMGNLGNKKPGQWIYEKDVRGKNI